MARTRVVNLMNEPYEVYIGRGSGRGQDGYFGNPALIHPGTVTREQSIMMYRAYFHDRIKTDAEFRRRVQNLRGKVLGCFCRPKACHGDVIVEYLEGKEWQPPMDASAE